ncbi:pyruvate kinase [Thermodesulfobacteriota bacterium]
MGDVVIRKTKIIATLGPATDTRDLIEKMIKMGVNVFRLNFSHGDYDYHETLINRVRTIAARLDMPVALLQDISGPKIRVGEIEGSLELQPGNILSISTGQTKKSPHEITFNHPEVLQQLQQGDHIYFADGTIRTEVVSVRPEVIEVKILSRGRLTSRKGVNLPLTQLPIDSITEKDREDIDFGVAHGVDFIALSFIRSHEDIKHAKKIIAAANGDIPVIAKIEMMTALDHLTEIMEIADGIMVARGDLGVELGVHKVPVVQKNIIEQARSRGIPVITATQMLTSMLTSPYPTRAEVSDIANAVLDGTDAVMLSDETAIGNNPEAAIRVLTMTINETEKMYPWNKAVSDMFGNRVAIAASATLLAEQSHAMGIACFTYSGRSAQLVACHRIRKRIIATTSNSKTFRRLSIVWGVEPFFVEFSHINSDAAISLFIKKARKAGLIQEEDALVIIIGHHSNQTGTINQIQFLDNPAFKRLQDMLRNMSWPVR